MYSRPRLNSCKFRTGRLPHVIFEVKCFIRCKLKNEKVFSILLLLNQKVVVRKFDGEIIFGNCFSTISFFFFFQFLKKKKRDQRKKISIIIMINDKNNTH